ncbi:putative RNA-directed DNA polymerase from transposon BS [Merluccius polli]|uniref:RNA-directed DNA polymerase from transposon BS n=1 Tax=Merluccius polli TaxID=89951 RepID=A0AA47NA51_MERPO|nr:putative RNA-directed DNA polymerase from transposon BS [Merluccius polli]
MVSPWLMTQSEVIVGQLGLPPLLHHPQLGHLQVEQGPVIASDCYVNQTQRRMKQGELPSALATPGGDGGVFKSGDREALRSARANLNHAIRTAKRAYGQKIQSFFHDPTNTRHMWQGIQNITDYNAAPLPCEDNTDFLNELNKYFGRFDVLNNSPARKSTPLPNEQALRLETADVRRTLRKVNARKAAGPDNIPFAYRSTEDAVSFTLYLSLEHLKKNNTNMQMLFLDFSSAFNTIIPQHLVSKLAPLGLNTPLCNWLLDFLTDRPQSVRVGRNTSSVISLSTGSPQGCVLSPLLFTLMTHDCRARFSTNTSLMVGLIRDNNELAYREEVKHLVDLCDTNNLILNVNKTKEIIVDFRKKQPSHTPLLINDAAVELVSSTKFLGVQITDTLTWSLHTSALVKRAQQHLHFLRRIRRANLPPPILTTFYRGTIESILTSCISVWFGPCNASDWKCVERVVRTAERIIGTALPSIHDTACRRCLTRAQSITKDPSHPHHGLFSLLPSGKRLCSIKSRTARFHSIFFPHANFTQMYVGNVQLDDNKVCLS